MSILLTLNGFRVLTGQPENDPEWANDERHHPEHSEAHARHWGGEGFD